MKANKTLVEMRQGEEGVVTMVQGGRALSDRLSALSIRPGAKLRKISGSFLGGPVTVQIGHARVALGFGMAARVFLDVEADPPP